MGAPHHVCVQVCLHLRERGRKADCAGFSSHWRLRTMAMLSSVGLIMIM